MGNNQTIRVLLVDDEPELLASVEPALTRRGMIVACAGGGEEGLQILARQVIDVVVLDMKMPGMSGMDALRAIKKSTPLVEVVVLTGHASLPTAVEALKEGAFDFLSKPAEVEALAAKIREAYERRMGKTSEEHQRRIAELLKLRRE